VVADELASELDDVIAPSGNRFGKRLLVGTERDRIARCVLLDPASPVDCENRWGRT
jgi:hypothetical protein